MFTRSRLVVTAVAALSLAVLGACASPAAPSGPDDGSPSSAPMTSAPASSAPATSAPATSAPATSAPASGPASGADAATLTLALADSSLGSILVDGKGKTLYMFANDSANTSTCTGQCLVQWPPLLGMPTEGDGVDDSKLGSFQRDDGSTQATYNGWPLYYWQGDSAAGDVTGQGVGGNWWVLDRDGDPVKS